MIGSSSSSSLRMAVLAILQLGLLLLLVDAAASSSSSLLKEEDIAKKEPIALNKKNEEVGEEIAHDHDAASTDSSGPFNKHGACVSLRVYEDEKCTGDALRTFQFETSSHPGGSCYHDASMLGYSVSDQYCDFDTGFWHQTLHWGTDECQTPWYFRLFSPMNQTFTEDGCIGGFQLNWCKRGHCRKEDEIDGVSTAADGMDGIQYE